MPAPTSNRERVLRAAKASFLVDGYRSSVERIAQRAGVAKQTVYHYFPSKDELFEAVARDYAQRLLIELQTGPGEVREGLLRFALAYRSRTLNPQGIAMFRTFVAETPRFRSLARAMYAAGAGETTRGLAAWLRRAMAAGRLRRDDPQFAAEVLMGMLVGHDRIKRLYGVASHQVAAEARRTARLVDCFLRAYSIEEH